MESDNSAKVARNILLGIAGFIVLILLLTTIKVVSVGQVGIVTRFGRVVGQEQSGLHFILPWPVETIRGMVIQTQKSQIEASAATLDLQTVSSTVALNYHLTDATAKTVYQNVGVNYVTTIIDPIYQEVFKGVTAQYNATDLITERAKVSMQTFQELQSELASKGITVDNLNIVNFSFSPEFSKAIEQKQVAAQNVLTQQNNLAASKLQAQAQETQKESLSPQYLELQAIQAWDGHLPNTLAGGGTVFNIPLSGQ